MYGEIKPILRLFAGRDNRYYIPVYQRNYDWKFQTYNLYQTILDIDAPWNHAIGITKVGEKMYIQLITNTKTKIRFLKLLSAELGISEDMLEFGLKLEGRE